MVDTWVTSAPDSKPAHYSGRGDVGRAVFFLIGWEVAAALIAIQVVIWVISPNALEVWCERGFIGKIRHKNVFGLGGAESK